MEALVVEISEPHCTGSICTLYGLHPREKTFISLATEWNPVFWPNSRSLNSDTSNGGSWSTFYCHWNVKWEFQQVYSDHTCLRLKRSSHSERYYYQKHFNNFHLLSRCHHKITCSHNKCMKTNAVTISGNWKLRCWSYKNFDYSLSEN